MKLWDAFLEDYSEEIFNWSMRRTLELFWNYCSGGKADVFAVLNKLNSEYKKEEAETQPHSKFDLERNENPHCPYCQEKTVPFTIEHDDGSGWMAGWTCNCEVLKHIEQCTGITSPEKSCDVHVVDTKA